MKIKTENIPIFLSYPNDIGRFYKQVVALNIKIDEEEINVWFNGDGIGLEQLRNHGLLYWMTKNVKKDNENDIAHVEK